MIDETFDPPRSSTTHYIERANDFDRSEVEADVAEWKSSNM